MSFAFAESMAVADKDARDNTLGNRIHRYGLKQAIRPSPGKASGPVLVPKQRKENDNGQKALPIAKEEGLVPYP